MKDILMSYTKNKDYHMSTQEIAEKLGVHQKTVEADLRNALDVLYSVMKMNGIKYKDLSR